MDQDLLVSTEWLADRLGRPDLAIIDCTAFLPTDPRDGRAEFDSAHIPGARFLDIAEVADRTHPAPHMLPSAQQFGEAMEALGVGRDERIVVYDHSPLRTAVRGWFMLRHFGARRVSVLDGGMSKWRAEGRPTESGDARPRPGRRFHVTSGAGDVVSKDDLLAGLRLPVLDARSKARFTGDEADPRPNVARGHIPESRSLPMSAFYRPDGTFVSRDDIRALFAKVGVDPSQPFVASCGSGVTANTLILAAALIGGDEARLYDGSWSEWGADPATPKALGVAG